MSRLLCFLQRLEEGKRWLCPEYWTWFMNMTLSGPKGWRHRPRTNYAVKHATARGHLNTMFGGCSKVPEGHHPRCTTFHEALWGNLPLRGLCGGLSEGSAGSFPGFCGVFPGVPRGSAGVCGISWGFSGVLTLCLWPSGTVGRCCGPTNETKFSLEKFLLSKSFWRNLCVVQRKLWTGSTGCLGTELVC